MSTTKLLISPAYVKQRRREMDENINDGPIESAIRQAQDLDIIPIIGSGLFNQIKSQLPTEQGGEDSLSDLNKTLCNDYLNPALAEYAFARALPAIHLKITQKGIMSRKAEFADPVESGLIKGMIKSAEAVANQYGQRLVDYLRAHSIDYPLYMNPGQGVDVIAGDGNQIRNAGGIHLGGDWSFNNKELTPNKRYGG